jgi:predicted phage terminase large subunit-like protein
LCPIMGQVQLENKLMRIRTMGPYITQGRIRFLKRSKGNGLLVKQLSSFPCGDHDDGPDALQGAISAAEDILSKSGASIDNPF